MKIKASELKALSKKLKIAEKNVLLDFQKDGIHAVVNSKDSIKMCCCHLLPTDIKDYKAIGKVGVRNIEQLHKYANRFKNFIHTTTKSNSIIMRSANRQFEDSLVDVELIKSVLDLSQSEVVKYDYKVTLNQADIDDLKGDGEALDEPKVIFNLKGDKLFVKILSDLTKVKSFIKAPGVPDTVDIKTKVQHKHFLEILKCVAALDCQISIMQDGPVRIIEQDGNLTTTYFCTPMVHDKKKKEEKVEPTAEEDSKDEEVDLD